MGFLVLFCWDRFIDVKVTFIHLVCEMGSRRIVVWQLLVVLLNLLKFCISGYVLGVHNWREEGSQ